MLNWSPGSRASKNVLSLFFFLLSAVWYFKAELAVEPVHAEETSPQFNRWYWLSLLAFVLAMLSKGSVAILPVLLLLVAWWHRDGIDKADLLRTAPFFFIAATLTLVNIWFQASHAGGETIRIATFLQRLLGAGAVVWFYLYKALLPLNLVFVYPQWSIDPHDFVWWLPSFGVLVVTARSGGSVTPLGAVRFYSPGRFSASRFCR